VFVIKAQTLADLMHGATLLTDRTVLPSKPDALVRLVISAGGKGRELVRHLEGTDKDKAFWADPAEPDHKLEQATGWVDRILKLRLGEFSDAVPTGDPALAVEIFDAQGSAGVFKLWPPDEKAALASSSRFAGGLSITKPNAEPILRELEAVLGEAR